MMTYKQSRNRAYAGITIERFITFICGSLVAVSVMMTFLCVSLALETKHWLYTSCSHSAGFKMRFLCIPCKQWLNKRRTHLNLIKGLCCWVGGAPDLEQC